MTATLKMCEVFRSIQGETSRAGLPCTFVRTHGCNLNCVWCDTQYARQGDGTDQPLSEVLALVRSHGDRLVCITGGEPLLQSSAVSELAALLLAEGQAVLVETNGSRDISPLPADACVIMDVKCPGSGEANCTLMENLERLRPRDEVKFVVLDRADFDWAVAFIRQHQLLNGPELLFAPVEGRLSLRSLAGWILESRLPLRLQPQFHRLLWPEVERGA